MVLCRWCVCQAGPTGILALLSLSVGAALLRTSPPVEGRRVRQTDLLKQVGSLLTPVRPAVGCLRNSPDGVVPVAVFGIGSHQGVTLQAARDGGKAGRWWNMPDQPGSDQIA